jgi:hypothetical protein
MNVSIAHGLAEPDSLPTWVSLETLALAPSGVSINSIFAGEFPIFSKSNILGSSVKNGRGPRLGVVTERPIVRAAEKAAITQMRRGRARVMLKSILNSDDQIRKVMLVRDSSVLPPRGEKSSE